MLQEHKTKTTTKSAPEPEVEVEAKTDLQDQGLTDTIDAMLDEIDEVLEVNAEEFVNSYIQAGGQ